MPTDKVVFFEGLAFGWVVNRQTIHDIGATQWKREILMDLLLDASTQCHERKIDEENR